MIKSLYALEHDSSRTKLIVVFMDEIASAEISSGTCALVDSAGNPSQEGEPGLLLYNGGTVCNRRFSINSANAICHVMG